MKQFLLKILGFSIIFVGIAFFLQFVVTMRYNGVGNKYKSILQSTQNVNSNIIILGSSRAWMQLSENWVSKTFNTTVSNLATNGHGEVAMYLARLKQYTLSNRPPKVALLVLDPLNRGGNLILTDNIKNKNQWAISAIYPSKNALPIIDYLGFDNLEKYVPMYCIFKYKLLEKCFTLKQNIQEHMTLGNEMYTEKWDTLVNPIENEKDKKAIISEIEIPNLINNLQILNSLCIKNTIKLIAIQLPVYKSLYDSSSFQNTKQICDKLGIAFFDFSTSNLSQNFSFFYNSNHLNSKGVLLLEVEMMKNKSFVDTLYNYSH